MKRLEARQGSQDPASEPDCWDNPESPTVPFWLERSMEQEDARSAAQAEAGASSTESVASSDGGSQ